MRKLIRVKCTGCDKWWWSGSRFLRRCPACKKIHIYDPVIYSYNYPYNKEMIKYGTWENKQW